jgi:hypothetical protein
MKYRWYELALPVFLLVVGIFGMAWVIGQAMPLITFFNQVDP